MADHPIARVQGPGFPARILGQDRAAAAPGDSSGCRLTRPCKGAAPIRERLPDSKARVRDKWWRYEYEAASLYDAIKGFSRVIGITSVSKAVVPAFSPADQVFAHTVYVFVYDDDAHFGLLSSAFHYWWAIARASTLETRIRYTPTDCFETFPHPELSEAVGKAGASLDAYRRQLMLDRWEGLTATYNRVHNPKEVASDIAEMRRLHVELDHAVASAYGWQDLKLDHDFWETRQGTRFTVSPDARVELLDRLLELNHARHEEEVCMGLHAKKTSKKRSTAAPSSPSDPVLFEVEP